ncbi:MAG: metallophosphoesterase family protein [Anaerolineae bacterium]|nr:metallophosphoesterase family protein [Anaerolineae bacterium]
MRLAVLSDIHGNLTALEAVLQDMEQVGGIDLTWCLGDLAAFGPRPTECIRRVKALAEADEDKKFKVIGGNTDRYLITGERPKFPFAENDENFQKSKAEWRNLNDGILWCVDQLSFEDYEFLKKINGQELGKKIDGYGYVIGYHAIPGNDETPLFPDTPESEARDFFLDREGWLGVGGHIHIQMDRKLGNWRAINVGSVGTPADVKGQASWGLFTFEDGQVQVELQRVPFDVEAVIADLGAVGFPDVEWAAGRLRV